MKLEQQILDLFCLEGKITDEHAKDIKAVIKMQLAIRDEEWTKKTTVMRKGGMSVWST